MSVYKTIRVPVPKDQWTTCRECDGLGTRMVGADNYVTCEGVGCDHGMIRTKVVRASQHAIQKAEEAIEDATSSIRRR